MGEAIFSVQSPWIQIQLLRAYRESLRESGVTDIRVEVTAVELPRQARMRAWLDFHHVRGDETVGSGARVIAYVTEVGQRLIVEMIQIDTVDLPDFARGLIEAARRD